MLSSLTEDRWIFIQDIVLARVHADVVFEIPFDLQVVVGDGVQIIELTDGAIGSKTTIFITQVTGIWILDVIPKTKAPENVLGTDVIGQSDCEAVFRPGDSTYIIINIITDDADFIPSRQVI